METTIEHIQELESETLSNTTQYWIFHKNTFQIQEEILWSPEKNLIFLPPWAPKCKKEQGTKHLQVYAF